MRKSANCGACPSCGSGISDFPFNQDMNDDNDIINSSESGQRHASTEMEIAVRAYELWQMAGAPPGRDLEFWFIAEGELHAEKQPAPVWEEAAGKQAALESLGE